MNLEQLFFSIHNNIESKEGKAVSRKEISERIHCSKGTYDKYMKGIINPKAVNNIMCLLSMMEDDDILKTVKDWKKNCEKDEK